MLPTRLALGLTGPRKKILGMEMAGEIESIGREVKQFEKGDEVFGMTDFGGGYAEYVCIPEAELPKKVMGAKKAQRTRRYLVFKMRGVRSETSVK